MKKRPSRRRKENTRARRPIILIVCEGELTEKNYFDNLRAEYRISSVHIRVIGKGRRGQTLVKEALTIARQMDLTSKKLSGTRDQVWCVFDRDDSLSQEVIDAITGLTPY
jgi:hypothetical protein